MIAKLLVCLVLATSAFAVTLPDFVPVELHEWIMTMREKCKKETGLTDADIESYVISNNAQPFMCYMKCLMLESKWMSSNLQIQYEVIGNVATGDLQKIVMEAVNKCRSIPEGKDGCEKAYNFNVCLQQADPVHYFLP